MARMLNIIMVALEICGLTRSQIAQRRWLLFTFYTQLSNLVATLASLALVIVGQPAWVTALRYLSVCMLVMTFIVTTCVLVPLGGDPKKLLWSGNGIYHHVLCPVLGTASYVLAERHAPASLLALPVCVTLVYGITLLVLNARRVVDGPYPFFRVHNQSRLASALWVLVLLAAISAISAGILAIAPA